MKRTPLIPDWIRSFHCPGYTNIFELLPEETKLFCTETLFGDWDAPTLLLAKDAAPVDVIQERMAEEDEDPWRHSRRDLDRMGWRTNEKLVELSQHVLGSKLYGSALAHLLKNDQATSSPLPGFNADPLRGHLRRVLDFVVKEMASLSTIICLGNESWNLVRLSFAPGVQRQSPRAFPVSVNAHGKPITVFRMYHTSRPFEGGWARRHEEWRRVGMAAA